MQVFYDKDADLSSIQQKRVAIAAAERQAVSTANPSVAAMKGST